MGLPLVGRGRATAVLLGWIAAAVVAGVIGVTAIDAVGQGLVGSSTTPLSAEQVDERLAEQSASATATTSAVPTASTPTTPSTSSAPPPATSPAGTEPPPATQPPASEPEVISTDGGSIVTECRGASPQVISATPAQGFQREVDADEGEGRARVEFESDSQDIRIRVEIFCVGGVPKWSIDQND